MTKGNSFYAVDLLGKEQLQTNCPRIAQSAEIYLLHNIKALQDI